MNGIPYPELILRTHRQSTPLLSTPRTLVYYLLTRSQLSFPPSVTMRLAAGFVAIVVSVSFFVVPPADACESSCRQGVSQAIADAYTTEDNAFWVKFRGNCVQNWHLGVTVDSALRNEAKKRITTTMTKLEKEFDDRFYRIIYDSLFKQMPKFMGDCGHPRLVKQPKTMPWPRDSCDKQAYICGNPPAICYFLNKIVKPRVFQNINTEYAKRSGGYVTRLQAALTEACTTAGLSTTETQIITSRAHENLVQCVQQGSTDFPLMFCYGSACDKYDEDIRLEILKWP